MPSTSFHKPTQKWLTSFGRNAAPGQVHTISVYSKSKTQRYGLRHWSDGMGEPKSCEFTHYLLGEPVAHDERFGEPLFDLSETPWACALDCPADAAEISRIFAMPVLSLRAAA